MPRAARGAERRRAGEHATAGVRVRGLGVEELRRSELAGSADDERAADEPARHSRYHPDLRDGGQRYAGRMGDVEGEARALLREDRRQSRADALRLERPDQLSGQRPAADSGMPRRGGRRRCARNEPPAVRAGRQERAEPRRSAPGSQRVGAARANRHQRTCGPAGLAWRPYRQRRECGGVRGQVRLRLLQLRQVERTSRRQDEGPSQPELGLTDGGRPDPRHGVCGRPEHSTSRDADEVRHQLSSKESSSSSGLRAFDGGL